MECSSGCSRPLRWRSAGTAAVYDAYFRWRGLRLTGTGRIGEGLKVLSPLLLHCVPEAGEF